MHLITFGERKYPLASGSILIPVGAAVRLMALTAARLSDLTGESVLAVLR